MLFFIKGIDSTGKTYFSFVDGSDHGVVFDEKEREGIFVTSIYKMPNFMESVVEKLSPKITPEEVIELIESIHLIIHSGLPLQSSIVELAEEADKPAIRKMLMMISYEINRGKSLSEAFEDYEHEIGITTVRLIRMGEQTGRLEETLKRATYFLKRTRELMKKAKSALIYPTFAFVAVSITMLVWLLYVLPQMTELFATMDLVLPPLTLFIIAVSDFMQGYSKHMFVILITTIVIFKWSHKKYFWMKYNVDLLLLKIPVIKSIISSFNTAFISEFLRLSTMSGVPLLESLDSLEGNVGSVVYKKALRTAKEEVEGGASLSLAFKNTKLFSAFTIRSIRNGESTGSLDDKLETIADFYYKKVEYFAENIGKIIEPVVLIIIGVFMAVIISGLMGPLYDLVRDMK